MGFELGGSLTRRGMLEMGLRVGTAVMGGFAGGVLEMPKIRLGPRTPEELLADAEALCAGYRTSRIGDLHGPLVRLVRELTQRNPTLATARAVALTDILLGQVHLQIGSPRSTARRCYASAMVDAELARDGETLGYAYLFTADLDSKVQQGKPADARQAKSCIVALEHAHRMAGPNAQFRAWTAARLAEEWASIGQRKEALDYLLFAEYYLSQSTYGANVGFCQRPLQIAPFYVSVHNLLGEHERAIHEAEKILAGLPDDHPRIIPVSIDLGAALAQEHEVGASCVCLTSALGGARKMGQTDRVDRIRSVFGQHLASQVHADVRLLGEQLRIA